jgi:hypothetical protein
MYMKLAPPSIPRDAVYTGCYCEENIYFLAQAFSADPDTAKYWDIFVVFISNRSKTVKPPLKALSAGLLTFKLLHRSLFGVKS